jgi:MarR family transcriptional regulator, transcriptional regulator for hemolysin
MSYLRGKAHEIRMLNMLVMKISRQQAEQRFAEQGIELTMFQFIILGMAKNHNITLTDISKRMGVDPSTLVPMVDNLVKKGYLKRERDPEDRRRYPLQLTEKGEALHLEAHQCMTNDPLETALTSLDEAEIEQLRVTLRKVIVQMPEGETALNEMEQHLNLQKEEPQS